MACCGNRRRPTKDRIVQAPKPTGVVRPVVVGGKVVSGTVKSGENNGK